MTLSIERTNKALWAGLGLAMLVHAAMILPFLVDPDPTPTQKRPDVAVTIANPKNNQRPTVAAFQSLTQQRGAGDAAHHQRLRTDDMGRDTRPSEQLDDAKGADAGADQNQSAGVIARAGDNTVTRTPGDLWMVYANAENAVSGAESQRLLADYDLISEQLRAMGDAEGQQVATYKSAQAGYINRWRQRIETIGTRRSLTDAGLTGSVEVSATLGHRGQLLSQRILVSSGDARIDQAARDILASASPFDPFPDAMTARSDRITINRVWQFRLGAPTLAR